MSFGDRLKREREQRGITLDDISLSTKIGTRLLRALEEARRKGIESICFLGRDGGFTKGIATIDLLVPGTVTARVQEAHKLLMHVLCDMGEEKLPKS